VVEIVVASHPDRDDLHAEIQVNGQPWAEVVYDRTREAYVVTMIPPTEDEEWPAFDLVELGRALAAAKNALVTKGYPDLKM
jgi:hypothetical protein